MGNRIRIGNAINAIRGIFDLVMLIEELGCWICSLQLRDCVAPAAEAIRSFDCPFDSPFGYAQDLRLRRAKG
jgi:hypothetical protein